MAAAKPEDAKAKDAPKDAAAGEKPAGGGGIMAWLPLILNILLMPALAFAMTRFVLLPKVTGQHGADPAAAEAEGEHKGGEEEKGHGAPAEGKEHKSGEKAEKGKEGKEGKGKFTAPLSSKVLVNVAGTMGARYLLANITLVSTKANLKEMVEHNDEQLRDAAAGALSTKTIADLEKPGARNLIRTELLTVFNSILGPGSVQELYLTEFAIQ